MAHKRIIARLFSLLTVVGSGRTSAGLGCGRDNGQSAAGGWQGQIKAGAFLHRQGLRVDRKRRSLRPGRAGQPLSQDRWRPVPPAEPKHFGELSAGPRNLGDPPTR